jgi:osmotically-inducible protein OsmY
MKIPFAPGQLTPVARWLSITLASTCLVGTLAGCVPLIIGGAMVGGALVATDRRTSGAQLEDEGIELRSNSRLRAALSDAGHVNVTSYNRQVLLTGEVSSEQEKKMVEDTVSRVDNVQKIVNELAIMPVTSIGQRSSDVLITGKVRAALVDAKDIYANAFKVVTERGITHLMGRVSQREADRATDIARTTSGVQKVVRIFEIISEEDLKGLLPQPAKPSSSPAVAPNPG